MGRVYLFDFITARCPEPRTSEPRYSSRIALGEGIARLNAELVRLAQQAQEPELPVRHPAAQEPVSVRE